ncbi:MAG: GNAT family N-acetyltransferase [Hymenobacteraceae bacterium]|nr:GNAT family N-acetyltransferase [Hymenobacteraceae bacterium]MDX5482366.1 GNAT family N-acetyltransferase [Hymenobacteraceae bacterium]
MKASAAKVLPIDTDLYLREAAVTDAAALYQLIDASRKYLREWLPFIDHSHGVSDTEQYLRVVTSPGNISDKVFVILYQKETAGIIGYKGIDRLNNKVEIGYWLGEGFQKKDIMRRACHTLLRYAFEKMSMNRIQINVGVGNSRSSNIPKKLGFTLEGIQRDGELLNGSYHNLEVYSLLRKDWERQHP